MIAIYGVCKLDPVKLIDKLAPLLREHGHSLAIANTDRVPQSKFVIFLSVNDLMQQAFALQTKKTIAVVFDYDLRLLEISGIEVFNDEVKLTYAACAALILKGAENKEHISIERKKADVISAILSTKKTTGFLHSYNTLIYTISNKEVREQFRGFIFSRMSGRMNKDAFERATNTIIPSRGKARESVLSLANLVNAEEGEKLRVAIIEARNTQTAVEDIAEKQKVEAYDLRYFLAAIAKAKANAKPEKPKRKAG